MWFCTKNCVFLSFDRKFYGLKNEVGAGVVGEVFFLQKCFSRRLSLRKSRKRSSVTLNRGPGYKSGCQFVLGHVIQFFFSC